MREMQELTAPSRDHTPLAARGSLSQTFRGLGMFTEAASVLAGGLFLALATVLLFYLFWPSYAKSVARRELAEGKRPVAFGAIEEGPGRFGEEPQWNLEKEEELPGPM
jgi:hypothetical protein